MAVGTIDNSALATHLIRVGTIRKPVSYSQLANDCVELLTGYRYVLSNGASYANCVGPNLNVKSLAPAKVDADIIFGDIPVVEEYLHKCPRDLKRIMQIMDIHTALEIRVVYVYDERSEKHRNSARIE